jgi:hypothetical protein
VATPPADIAAVRQRLRDTGSVSTFGADVELVLDKAVQSAVTQYSSDRPREVVVDLTGNGTPFYKTSLMTGWVDEWSQALKIEYPAETVGASDYPTFLDPSSDWRLHRDATYYYLWLVARSPAASETIRVWFTIPHTVSTAVGAVPAADTIPTPDKESVLDLAASIACMHLATEAAQSTDMDVPSDSTNYRDAADKLFQAAREWRMRYDEHMRQA